MGYFMNQREANFTIKKEYVDKAWNALIELLSKEDITLSWIDNQEVLNSTSFEKAMSECRWNIEVNEQGDYDSIYFNGEKYGGDEEVILEVIAPYVEDGSYIQKQGEEGEQWRWIFDEGKVIEKCATLIWE